MPTALCLLLPILFLAGYSVAAPPPEHPDPARAGTILGLPGTAAALPYRGRVVEARESNSYTYLKVVAAGRELWLAAPRIAILPGATVAFGPGRTFAPWYSKKLQRRFAEVTFVSRVDIVPGALPDTGR